MNMSTISLLLSFTPKRIGKVTISTPKSSTKAMLSTYWLPA